MKLARPEAAKAFWFGEAAQLTAESLGGVIQASGTIERMSDRSFVHVVESPSPADMLDGNFEGRVLYQALCTSRIDASYAIAADSQTFFEAIGNRLLDRIIADQYRAQTGRSRSGRADRREVLCRSRPSRAVREGRK